MNKEWDIIFLIWFESHSVQHSYLNVNMTEIVLGNYSKYLRHPRPTRSVSSYSVSHFCWGDIKTAELQKFMFSFPLHDIFWCLFQLTHKLNSRNGRILTWIGHKFVADLSARKLQRFLWVFLCIFLASFCPKVCWFLPTKTISKLDPKISNFIKFCLFLLPSLKIMDPSTWKM